MKRALIDLRSVLWTAIMAGKDKEGGRTVLRQQPGSAGSASMFGGTNL